MTAPLISLLDGTCPDDHRLSTLGGKGAALDAMIAGDLPVPATAVVTVSAYRHFVAQPHLSAVLSELADSGFDDRAIADEEIDAAFAACPVDAGLLRDLVVARHHVAAGGLVAVRSSATTEDLGGASFAGQYESILRVDSDDALAAAVVRVWASLWHRAPRLYRRLHGIPDDAAAMAVLVQQMVSAIAAGVVFTIDPGGVDDHLRVERVDGLGEALVSGRVTPTVHLVPRVAALDDPAVPREVRSAAAHAMACEELFGTPQDVEWADDGDRVWIVQSRAITTNESDRAAHESDGFDSPLAAHRRYTTAGVAEMLPGVLPVLVWSTAGFMVEEAYRTVTAQLGALPPTIGDDGFIVRARGRAALDLDHMNDVARELPGGSPDDVEEQFFGTRRTAEMVDLGADTPPPSLRARLRHDLRVLRANRTARSEQAVTQQAIARVLSTPVDTAAMSDSELLAARLRLTDLGLRATIAEFSIAAAAVAAFHRLESLLVKYFGEPAGPNWALRVTSTLRPDTMIRRATELAEHLGHECPELMRCAAWDDARTHLEHTARTDLLARITAAADRAGCQRVIAGRTWSEEPEAFWQVVIGAFASSSSRSGDAAGSPEGLTALADALVGLPGWRRTRWLTGQIVDVRRQVVFRLIRTTTDLLERRETAKSMLLRLGGRLRLIDAELGRRLANAAHVIDAGDVVHLHPAEIREALVHDRAVAPDVVLARRRRVERWRSEDDLPLTFTGHPTPVPMTLPRGDRLDGWGASPGRHTGPIRFLRSPDDAVVEAGDVVVARRTDASWSPVFLRAAAIVVEEGGPLSHAAIVAREFGLPAVVNVPGAATRLRDERAPVTVDGDRGLVFISTVTDEPADARQPQEV